MNMNSLTKKLLVVIFVMAAVGAAGWFGRKAYRKATESRFVAQARRNMEKNDANEAAMCLRRALQINPTSVEASATLADLLETLGVPGALSWRMRAAQLAPSKPQYRFAWARTAIQLREFASARTALDGLQPKDKDTLQYHKLDGALAWDLSDTTEARRQYAEALRREPNNLTLDLNLAIIDLASTNPSVATAGSTRLEQLATNAEVRIPALRQLAKAAFERKSFSSALDYARGVVETPGATFKDRIDYLQVLRATTNNGYSSYLSALKRDSGTNSAQASVLAAWIASAESPTNAMLWLQSLPTTIQTNQPVATVFAECLAALKDWPSLLTVVRKQDWGEANFYRLALESLAHASLKEDVAAQAVWQKAINLSKQRLDRLSRLAQLSSSWNRDVEKVEVLRELTTEFPKERWAASLLISQYHRQGNTRALAEVLANSYSAEPNDPSLKSSLANISLLRKSDLERAHRMAREAYESAPDNPFFASTYAYSLLLQERREEAAKVISEVKTNFLQIPFVAAYYGVVQARSGHKDLARESLKIAEKASLLPEEMEMVQLAQSQL